MRLLRFTVEMHRGVESLPPSRYAGDASVEPKGQPVSVVFWAWVTVAVVVLLGEAVTGGLFVAPWAAGATVAALLEALHIGIDPQWIAFFTVSSVVLVVVQRLKTRRR